MQRAAKPFTLEAFSRHEFYREVNRRLIDRCGLRPGQRVVDLGCGNGAVTALVVERMAGRPGEVIGIDPSEDQLSVARRSITSAGQLAVRFLQGTAENLTRLIRRQVDAVLFFNAIHMVEDKRAVLGQVGRVLRPGGVFAFNSTFYAGAEPPEAEQFYRRWMMRALRTLKSEYHTPPPRGQRAQARRRLTPGEYHRLLGETGFQVRDMEETRVEMPEQGFRDLSTFADFMRGILPGIPYETASQVLCRGLSETFAELQLRSSPRNWLLVVAEKGPAAA